MLNYKQPDRRKFERVKLPLETITISSSGTYGNMIELSEGGFSADYSRRYTFSDSMKLSGGILINVNHRVFYVSDLHFKIVWVRQDKGFVYDSSAVQRVGVEFNELLELQQNQVKHLVQSCKDTAS